MSVKIFALVAALGLFGAPSSHAADAVSQEAAPVTMEKPGWAVQITPYLWAAGLEGDISPFRSGPTIGVDKSFSDVVDDLNFGGFVNLWGRYERFVVSGDMMYTNTTDSHGSGPLPALQIPGLGTVPPGATVDASVDTKQFMATLQGGYRVIDSEQMTLDVLAGARFWHISNDVTVTASHVLAGSLTASHDESFGWVDPVVGMRAFLPLTEKLSFQAQADIGGFGAGADLTWSVLATANYVVTDHFSVSAGYKTLKVDYDSGGHVFDTTMSGPVLGGTYRF